MKPVLALRHVPHEDLGILEDVFRQAGLVYSYVDLFQSVPRNLQPRQLAGLVVLGGPMNVDETDRYPYLATSLLWIREAIDAGVPVLGICLGSQLLAKALGSEVRPNGIKEIGWYPIELLPQAAEDRLFNGCEPKNIVFQWHGDTFDLPAGAVQLARSSHCEQQAFRYGDSAYGLQFHMEVTPAMVETWLQEPANCGELASLDYIRPEEIRRRLPQETPPMQQLGRRVFGRFAELCRQQMSAS